MGFSSILLALLIFGALIFIHELGHFLAARAFGVRILEFSIGMGPKLISRVSRKSGTRYSLRLFPIGGFVSMYGENGMEVVQGAQEARSEEDFRDEIVQDLSGDQSTPEPEESADEPEIDPELAGQAYCNKNVWIRILISLAGPMMNLLLGFFLMLILVVSAGQASTGTTEVAGFYVVYQGEESDFGLQKDDYLYQLIDGKDASRILSTEDLFTALRNSPDGTVRFTVLRWNEEKSDYDEIPIEANPDEEWLERNLKTSVSAATGESGGLAIGDVILKINRTSVHTAEELSYEIMNQGNKPITFTVLRNGEKTVLPGVQVPTDTSQGVLFGEMDFLVRMEKNFGIGTILKHTFFRSISAVKMVYDSIAGLFSRRYGFEAVSGPVGITKTISTVAKSGQILTLLNLVIIISINLGVMNLLPIPALDGGHLLIYFIEAIRRKPIPRKIEGAINFVGLIAILLLAVIIAIKDVIAL